MAFHSVCGTFGKRIVSPTSEPLLKHEIRPQRHFDKALQSHTQEEEKVVVSLEGQSKQSKQSIVAPGVRGELFDGEHCVLREGWTGVSGAQSLYRYLDL